MTKTCKYAVLLGKREFASVTKELDVERLAWTVEISSI